MSNENTKGPGDMQQELDEMIDDRQSTDNQEVDTPEPEIKTETTATEEAVETKEETEEVVKEESEQPAEVVEEPTEPEPSKEVKDSEEVRETTLDEPVQTSSLEEDLRAQNESLLKQVEALSQNANKTQSDNNLADRPTSPPKAQTEIKAKPTSQPDVPEDNIIDFINEDTFEEIQSNPKKLNQVLTSVYNMAVQNTYNNTPKMVDNMIKQRTYLNDKVDVFYKENDDLLPYRQFVGFVANELTSQNPDWELDAVFEKTAEQVRDRLGLKKKILDKAKKANTKPAFAKAKKSNSRDSANKPNLSEMEEQIQDLL